MIDSLVEAADSHKMLSALRVTDRMGTILFTVGGFHAVPDPFLKPQGRVDALLAAHYNYLPAHKVSIVPCRLCLAPICLFPIHCVRLSSCA